MTDVVPAWSDEFFGDGPGSAPAARFLPEIDRELAYGDGTGSGVRVAIIDSGVEDGHPWVGRVDRFVTVEYDPDIDDIRFVEGPHDDLYGHGTACAGIVRALAPGVELVSLRVLGGDLSGSAYDFAHALEWCIDNDVQIVNLSLSTSNEDFAEVFYELVDAATYSDVLVVSAMNNERKRSIPSEFAGVFSVACCEGDDPERFLYNPRAPAAFGAVGIDVEVAWVGGTTIVASGNSFAAPVITGHLARIVGAHPGITAWQARTLLAAMAANATDASMPAPERRHRV
jgi:subtilisin family serine protease